MWSAGVESLVINYSPSRVKFETDFLILKTGILLDRYFISETDSRPMKIFKRSVKLRKTYVMHKKHKNNIAQKVVKYLKAKNALVLKAKKSIGKEGLLTIKLQKSFKKEKGRAWVPNNGTHTIDLQVLRVCQYFCM